MRHRTVAEQLRARFRDKAAAPETLFLLNAEDALKFIAEASDLGLILAGVEGFVITDAGAYQPRQDFSNDAADCPGQSQQFLEQTKQLIRRGASSGIRFQVIVDDTDG